MEKNADGSACMRNSARVTVLNGKEVRWMQLFDKPLELVILDVDGVLLDQVVPQRRMLEIVAREFNLPGEPIGYYLAELQTGIRHGYPSFTTGLCAYCYPQLPKEEVRRFALRFQEERRRDPFPPIPGSIETLTWLRMNHIPLALCTSNDEMTLCNQLSAAGIDRDWFVVVSTSETPHRKPDRRALDPIFDVVRVPRSYAVYIGDWYPDLEVANGAGVRFVAVLSGGIPRHAFLREGVPEDHIIERLVDLPKLITD